MDLNNISIHDLTELKQEDRDLFATSKDFAKILEETESVFNSKETLDLAYLPKELIWRDAEISYLSNRYNFILDVNAKAHSIGLLLGPPGVGKTLLARFFVKKIQKLAEENNIPFFPGYYNCTHFKKVDHILIQINARVSKGTGRGYTKKELIFEALHSIKGKIFLIIDDIGLMTKRDLEMLLNIEEFYKDICKEKNCVYEDKLSLLLLSRTSDWQKILSSTNVENKVDFALDLKPYSYEETEKILDFRYGLAFKKGLMFEGGKIDPLIVKYVSNHKNMRLGIELLNQCGMELDISKKMFLNADTIKTVYKRIIYDLYLKEIANSYIKNYAKVTCKFRNNSDRDLILKTIIELCDIFYENVYNLEFPNLTSYNNFLKEELTKIIENTENISINYLKEKIIPYTIFYNNLERFLIKDVGKKYSNKLEKILILRKRLLTQRSTLSEKLFKQENPRSNAYINNVPTGKYAEYVYQQIEKKDCLKTHKLSFRIPTYFTFISYF